MSKHHTRMTAEQFVKTWHNNPLNEEAGAQANFEDLCTLLDEHKPRDKGSYCFELKSALSEGRTGYADDWKDRFFDYKPEMADDEILRRLLALNLERADSTDTSSAGWLASTILTAQQEEEAVE